MGRAEDICCVEWDHTMAMHDPALTINLCELFLLDRSAKISFWRESGKNHSIFRWLLIKSVSHFTPSRTLFFFYPKRRFLCSPLHAKYTRVFNSPLALNTARKLIDWKTQLPTSKIHSKEKLDTLLWSRLVHVSHGILSIYLFFRWNLIIFYATIFVSLQNSRIFLIFKLCLKIL